MSANEPGADSLPDLQDARAGSGAALRDARLGRRDVQADWWFVPAGRRDVQACPGSRDLRLGRRDVRTVDSRAGSQLVRAAASTLHHARAAGKQASQPAGRFPSPILSAKKRAAGGSSKAQRHSDRSLQSAPAPRADLPARCAASHDEGCSIGNYASRP